MVFSVEKQPPVAVKNLDGHTITADFGKDAFAQLELEVEMSESSELTIAAGEVLSAAGRVEPAPGGSLIYRKFVYQAHAGKQRFFMEFPEHVSPYQGVSQRSKMPCPEYRMGGEIAPFRYAEVTGKGIRTVKFIRHAFFGPMDEDAAGFNCSDTRLNQIWELCKYTVKATGPFGVYIDGDRERQAFEGDTYINALAAYCTGGGYEIARRTITFLLDYFPICCWEYRMLMPVLIRDYILYSGDTESYRFWRQTLHERLERFQEYILDDGMVHHCYREKFTGVYVDLSYQYLPFFPLPMQLLVDWPDNERDGYEYGENNFFANVFLLWAYQAMAELEPESGYGRRARVLRQKIRETFLLADGRVADSAMSQHMSLHTAVLALWTGVVTPAEAAPLAEYIQKRGMACSVYGAQYLLDVCFAFGMGRHGMDLLCSDGDRSWLNMLKQGSTVTMEAWNPSRKKNLDWNHAWGAAPGNVIPRWIGGIRPLKPGFAEFTVAPQPGHLEYFHLKHPTPHGAIELIFDRGVIHLTVPPDTTAFYQEKTLTAGNYRLNFA